MAPKSPDRTKEVFFEASELSGAERAEYLEKACAGDPELRREVEALLEASEDDGDDVMGWTSVGQLLFASETDGSTLVAGDIVNESFRIVRLIGTGGMGEVYEAEDLRLGTRVAVKTLRSRFLRQPEFAARFRREILLARRVTHRNVCRVFDPGRARVRGNDILYLTMELVDGETLSTRIKRGGLAPDEVVPIICQIAQGLEALHAADVIHRDLKPSNVIVSGYGESLRVVITDFGLAHNVLPQNADESLTVAGQVVGTLAYAAPEQLSGRRVGPGADLYSLGLMMYEMLTGRKPFDGDTAIAAAARKLNQRPQPPSFHLRSARGWDGLVLRCLEPDPGKRIASATEFLNALKTVEARRGFRQRGPIPPHKRVYWGVAAALLTTVAVLEFTPIGAPVRRRICQQMPGSVVFCDLPPIRDIAVLPFESSGKTEVDRALAAGWARYVRESFHRLALDPSHMCVHLRNDRLSEGVRMVMEGSTQAAGDSVVLNIRIRENDKPGSSSRPLVLRQVTLRANAGTVDALEKIPLAEMARAVGISYPAREWAAWSASRPQYASTAAAHLRGLGYLENGRFDKAAEEFNSAIDPARDFAFAPVHVGLGDAYRLMFSATHDASMEVRARRAYERALPLDRDHGFGGAERGLAELDTAAGRTEDAIEHYKAALQFWPFDHPLQKSLVAAYEARDKVDEAEAVLRSAAARNPRCWQPHNALGSLLSRHARLPEAEKSFLELIRLAPDNGSAYHNLAFDYVKMGRYDDAINMAAKSLEVRPYPMAYATLARAYLYRGCTADAAINARKAVELDPEYHVLWSTLADVLEAVPEETSALAASERSVSLAQAVLAKGPGDAITRARYAVGLARLGDRESAVRQARIAVLHSPGNQHVLSQAAEALERAGQREEALSIVERALRSGLSVPEIEQSVGLRNLRRDPKYPALLTRLKLDPAADPGQLTPRTGACPGWQSAGKGLKQN